jgi:hypothetical protein
VNRSTLRLASIALLILAVPTFAFVLPVVPFLAGAGSVGARMVFTNGAWYLAERQVITQIGGTQAVRHVTNAVVNVGSVLGLGSMISQWLLKDSGTVSQTVQSGSSVNAGLSIPTDFSLPRQNPDPTKWDDAALGQLEPTPKQILSGEWSSSPTIPSTWVIVADTYPTPMNMSFQQTATSSTFLDVKGVTILHNNLYSLTSPSVDADGRNRVFQRLKPSQQSTCTTTSSCEWQVYYSRSITKLCEGPWVLLNGQCQLPQSVVPSTVQKPDGKVACEVRLVNNILVLDDRNPECARVAPYVNITSSTSGRELTYTRPSTAQFVAIPTKLTVYADGSAQIVDDNGVTSTTVRTGPPQSLLNAAPVTQITTVPSTVQPNTTGGTGTGTGTGNGTNTSSSWACSMPFLVDMFGVSCVKTDHAVIGTLPTVTPGIDVRPRWLTNPTCPSPEVANTSQFGQISLPYTQICALAPTFSPVIQALGAFAAIYILLGNFRR